MRTLFAGSKVVFGPVFAASLVAALLLFFGFARPVNKAPLESRYLHTVRRSVSGLLHKTVEKSMPPHVGNSTLYVQLDLAKRARGEDWPVYGITMIGDYRLLNIETLLRTVIAEQVQGDFIECGVWRGGASIFAKAIFTALNVQDRSVWLADSFEGLPEPRTHKDDKVWSKMTYLRVSKGEVEENFRSYGLLDASIRFCEGYFIDSLPKCPVEKIAVLRMDGDMYESTMDQLFNLYEKITIGGFVIVDDWTISACRSAIDDFRRWHAISSPIVAIDNSSIYWQKKHRIHLQRSYYKFSQARDT